MVGVVKGEKCVPAIEGWFKDVEGGVCLIGSKCKSCSEVFFPKTNTCVNSYCESMLGDVEDTVLSRTGTLWSYSVNYYPPPVSYVDPKKFKPYVVAAVDLDNEKIKVCGRLSESVDHNKISIGMKVELVLETLYKNNAGDDVVTWMWKPIE